MPVRLIPSTTWGEGKELEVMVLLTKAHCSSLWLVRSVYVCSFPPTLVAATPVRSSTVMSWQGGDGEEVRR